MTDTPATHSDRQPLPVPAILNAIGDASSDHHDGTHHGYYSLTYDQQTGLLSLSYEADDDAPHGSTTAVFRFVGSGLADAADDDPGEPA
jgi:hypothetical protein